MSRINVIVRKVNTDLTDEQYEELLESLYRDRKEKVRKFKNRRAAFVSLTAGLLLQETACAKLGIGVDDIIISRGAHGKPCIEGYPKFHYNLSHSGEYVVLVYSDMPVGIDIEQIKDKFQKVAARCFTTSEISYLDNGDFEVGINGSSDAERFCQIWTMKESYLKLTGQGISVPLNSFSIDLKNMFVEGTDCHFATTRIEDYYITVCASDISDISYEFA